MKKLMIYIFIVLMALPVFGAISPSIDTKKTYKNAYRWTGKPKDKLLDWAQAMEDAIDGTTGVEFIYYIPTATGSAPATTEGYMYYDSTTDTIKYRNASTWISLAGITEGSAGTLDDSYNSGYAIDVDGTAVTLTVSDNDNNAGLIVTNNDATNNSNCIEAVVAASNTGAGLYVDGTTGTIDLLGDNFSMANTGVLTALGLVITTEDIELENGAEIQNVVDTELRFIEDNGVADEDIIFDFGTNLIALKSGTGVDELAMGAVDDLTGVGSIVMDDAATTITSTGTTNAYDLTIAQAGTIDVSLILSSAGSITDALSLITTDAVGVIKISSSDILDVDSVDHMNFDISGASADFFVNSGAGSVQLDGGEAADDAINLDAAAGGLDVDVALSIALTTTESESDSVNIDSAGGVDIDIAGGAAGEDFSVTTDTSITLTATENAAETVHIEENAGSSGAINIYANQGEAASATTEHDASIQLHSDAGGISLYTTGNVDDAVRIETNGGTDEFITINNLQGTGADAITISANAAGGDLNLQSVLGRIEIEAEEDVANAVLIIADGDTASTLELFNDTGTSVTESAASIQLASDVGGIGLYTNANLDDAIVIQTDGGTTAEMLLWADQGDAVTSIELLSDAGGITMTAAKPVAVTNAFELDVVVLPTTTPITILANNSGQVHMIPDTAQDTTFNMPAEADNLHYEFWYVGGAADAHDWIIQTGDDTEQFVGGLVHHDSDGELTAVVYSDQGSNSRVTILTPEAGTKVELRYDLATTSWYITGTVISATNTAIVFADN